MAQILICAIQGFFATSRFPSGKNLLKKGMNCITYLLGEERRDSVSNLNKLLSSSAFEEVIVWKGLKPCCFSHCQGPTLFRIGMNEVVTILRNMTGNGCRWVIPKLHPESVSEIA
jgi:hypothetical protein